MSLLRPPLTPKFANKCPDRKKPLIFAFHLLIMALTILRSDVSTSFPKVKKKFDFTNKQWFSTFWWDTFASKMI